LKRSLRIIWPDKKQTSRRQRKLALLVIVVS